MAKPELFDWIKKQHPVIGKIFLEGWRPFLWLSIASLIMHHRSLYYGYCFDDYRLIVANYRYVSDIRNIWIAFAKSPYWQDLTPYYRPILTISLMIDAVLAGLKPHIYHLTNILIHAAACCLIYVFFLRMGYYRTGSFVVSLLFCVHPALVQAVAWIPGRNDSLLTLVALASFTFLTDYLKIDFRPGYWLHLLLFLVSLFTKETALLLPVAYIAYSVYILGERVFNKSLVRLYLGWLVCLSVYWLARMHAVQTGPLRVNTLTETLVGLVYYAGKAVFPVGISVFPVPGSLSLVYGLLVMGACLAAVFMIKMPGGRRFIFGAGWFLLFLLPTTVRVTDFALFLEQRLYLPLAGLGIMLLEVNEEGSKVVKQALSWAALPALIVFATVSARHSGNFNGGFAFWQNAVRTSPGCYFVHHMMGNNYLGQNLLQKAEEEYKTSIKLNPSYPKNYDKMSLIMLARGDSVAAEEYLRQTILIDSLNPLPYNTYGVYLLDKGDFKKAEAMFNQAAKLIGPRTLAENQSVIFYNQGLIDFNKGLTDQALGKFEKALQRDPYDAKSMHQIGVIKYLQNRWAEAESFQLRALELDTACGEAYMYLGLARFNQGDLVGAWRALIRARNLMPVDPSVYEHLAFIHYQNMDIKSAAAYYDSAIAFGLKPDPKVLKMLGKR